MTQLTPRTVLRVPGPMLAAFLAGRGHQSFGDFSSEYRAGLESVLRWLEAKLDGWSFTADDNLPAREAGYKVGYNQAIADVLGIFQANPVVEGVKRSLAGCTLTLEEAEEIMEYVNRCVPPEDPSR